MRVSVNGDTLSLLRLSLLQWPLPARGCSARALVQPGHLSCFHLPRVVPSLDPAQIHPHLCLHLDHLSSALQARGHISPQRPTPVPTAPALAVRGPFPAASPRWLLGACRASTWFCVISNPRCLVYFLSPHPHSTQSHAEPSWGFGRGRDADDFVRSKVASLSSSPCQARSPLPCEAQWAVCGLHLHHLPETQFCINCKSQMAQIWTLTCCVALGALITLSVPHSHYL